MVIRQTGADPLVAAPGPGGPDGGIRAFWANATIGVFRCSLQGRPMLANPALVRLNGYDTEEEMIADLAEGAGRYVEPGRRQEFCRILETRGMVSDFRSEIYRYRTRERIWVCENAWTVRDALGQVLYYEGTVTDVTTEVHKIAALAENERRLSDFAQTASDWFWETGPDHRFTRLTSRTVTGLEPDARPGWIPRDLAADLDDPRLPELIATLDRRLPFRDVVQCVTLADGTAHHIAVSGKPVFAADGAFLGYRGNARDVSSQIDAQRQLREAWRQADEMDRAKSEFLATMSHELREPLNAIIGFADVMREGTLPVELCTEYAGHVHDSSTHLLDLINDVLDMSKIAAGKMQLHLEPVQPEEALSRAVAMVTLRAEQDGIRLETLPEPDLPSLRADGLRLGQILLNLISNAVKFTPSGGSIALRCRRAGDDHLLFEVADTGDGMTQEEIKLAQQPFTQVHRDGGDRSMAQGSGLGLSITRNLVELHGGTFRIESVRGSGTTVRVLLPIEGPRR